jgi:hypothetical protein
MPSNKFSIGLYIVLVVGVDRNLLQDCSTLFLFRAKNNVLVNTEPSWKTVLPSLILNEEQCYPIIKHLEEPLTLILLFRDQNEYTPCQHDKP